MKNTYAVVIVLIIVVVGAILMFGKSFSGNPGNVVFAIKDASTDISGVSSINVTVDQISVHNDAKGWVTASTESKVFDLMALKASGAIELAGQSSLEAGTYDQVRLNISKVIVVKNGQSVEAKLPSNTLTLTAKLVVEANKTSTITFDFLADKSLHATGNGKYILAPVVKLQTKSSADVTVTGKNVVIVGGKVEHESTEGVDQDGKKLIEVNGVLKLKVGDDDDQGDDNDDNDGDKADDNDGAEIKLNLSAQNNSGIAGTVKLESEDSNKVEVKINLTTVPTGVLGLLGISLGASHPAHIHSGTCANIGSHTCKDNACKFFSNTKPYSL